MQSFKIPGLIIFLLALVSQPIALSHQSMYEESRLRQGNFWETDGATAPYYVDEGCPIPGSFSCRFARSEDWTFDRPFQMVEEMVVPDPGYPGLASDIACTTDSDCPGSCVLNRDSQQRCDLSPGTARPNVGVVYRSRLVGAHDIDWGVWNYQPNFGAVPMIIYPSVAACIETLNQFPSVVIAGPLDILDPESGEPLFSPIGNFDLPEEIVENLEGLPGNYGVRLTEQGDNYVPSASDPRPGYFSIFGPGVSMYNKGTLIEPCVEDYETCVNDPESENFDYNEFFLLEHDEPVALYVAVWDRAAYAQRDYYDDLRRKRDREKQRILDGTRWSKSKLNQYEKELESFIVDVGLVFGSRDSMTPGDSLRQSIMGAATGGGRNNHGTCTNPVPTGKVNIQKYPTE